MDSYNQSIKCTWTLDPPLFSLNSWSPIQFCRQTPFLAWEPFFYASKYFFSKLFGLKFYSANFRFWRQWQIFIFDGAGKFSYFYESLHNSKRRLFNCFKIVLVLYILQCITEKDISFLGLHFDADIQVSFTITFIKYVPRFHQHSFLVLLILLPENLPRLTGRPVFH